MSDELVELLKTIVQVLEHHLAAIQTIEKILVSLHERITKLEEEVWK